jgi:hypothetical protein
MREQYRKMFGDGPDLRVTIANRIAVGEFAVYEEHLSGFHFGDLPIEMTAVAVYRVTPGKIAKLMLLG